MPGVPNDIGVWFDVRDGSSTGGLRFESQGSVVYANWTGADNGFLRLHKIQAGATAGIYLDIYHIDWSSNELDGARLDELWNDRDKQEFWPIHRFVLGDKEYHFQRMEENPYIPDSFAPADFGERGSDFSLHLASENLLRGGATDDDSLNIGEARADC